MGLKETIKETKEKLELAVEEETKVEAEQVKEIEAKIEEVVKSEEKKEEPKKEEVKAEDIKEEVKEPEKTNADFAKDRIAKKKEKDRIADELSEARARIAELEKTVTAPKAEVVTDPEPDINAKPVEWVAWKQRQQDKSIDEFKTWKKEQEAVKSSEKLKNDARREVSVYEDQLRKSATDYDDVKNWYVHALATSIKIVNPKITNDRLIEAVDNRLLTRIAELQGEGYENPVEAMYVEVKNMGYQPKAAEKEEKKIEPDLDKVANFRKRNAGMAGAGGGGAESEITPTVATKMTNAEFAKLKPEQKKRLFASLR